MKMLWITLLGLLATPVLAQPDIEGKSPSEAGNAIADYAEDYHSGWVSSISTGRMILIDDQGEETVKELETISQEKQGDEESGRSFIIYDTEGTGLLTYMYRKQDDVQWVWVPGLKRKFRIQANNMSGAFIGSEFSYEDLRSQYPQKFDIQLLREEEYQGQKCWVLERVPTAKVTNYSRQNVWMEQADYRILKTDFYDQNDKLLKTLTTHEWEKRDDGFWRSDRSEMINHQTGRASRLVTDTVELKAGIKSFKKYMR